MAFCKMCGNQLGDNNKFCIKCGAPIVKNVNSEMTNDETNARTAIPTATPMPAPVPSPMPESAPIIETSPIVEPVKKKKSKVAIVLIIIFVLLAAAGGGAFYYIKYIYKNEDTKRQSVKIAEYVEITLKGYNSKGTASAMLKHDPFCEALFTALNTDKDNASDSVKAKVNNIYNSIKVVLDRDTGLSNGEKIKISFEVSKSILESVNIDFDTTGYETEIKQLSPLNEINPFDYISLEFEGITGEGTVKVVIDEGQELFQYLYVNVSKNSEIKIGDTITCSISQEYVDIFLNDNGIVLTETSKEYVVGDNDLATYVSDMSELDNSVVTDMNNIAVQKINEAYTAKKGQLENFDYYGAYILCPKEGMAGKNGIYIVYKGDVKYPHNSENNEDSEPLVFDVFIPVLFTGVIKNTDGSFTWENFVTLTNKNLYIEGYSEKINGYDSEETMFIECVRNETDFDYKLSGNLIEFAEVIEYEESEE